MNIGGSVKCTTIMENSMEDPQKIKHRTIIQSSNSTAVYLSNGNEINILKDTCTCNFTAALFIIAETWKQPKCPLTDEQINERRSLYTMEYCSASNGSKC